MIGNAKVVVVMPAYNAAQTLRLTVEAVDRTVVDDIIVVDDASQDETVSIAREMGLCVLTHERNKGYGANQKTCYSAAISQGADIVVMVHPDYQYDPRLIPAMAYMINSDIYDVVLGSRILGRGALQGGMPVVKFVANRFLTAVQNLMVGLKLSEYHTGYRAFRRDVLDTLPLTENSDDFVFDNQMLCQVAAFGFRIGEMSCPTKYFKEASSISLSRSIVYGLGVLRVSFQFLLHRLGILNSRLFRHDGRRLTHSSAPINPDVHDGQEEHQVGSH